MKLNCKPGDLAIVVRSDVNGDIGTIVEVLHRSFVDDDGDHQWLTKWPRPTRAFGHHSGREMLVVETFIPDAWLRPVSGLPITDDIKDEVTA